MKLINLVRNGSALKHSPPNTMILLLAIAIWIFLTLLTVTVCVSAQRGDLAQSPASTARTDPADRSQRLRLPRDPDEREPLTDDARAAA